MYRKVRNHNKKMLKEKCKFCLFKFLEMKLKLLKENVNFNSHNGLQNITNY